MSMIGELKFFLGIQIDQCKDGVYVHQSKYTKELVKKFNLDDYKMMTTPMHPTCTLSKKGTLTKVDHKLFRGMIGSLLHLTASRPDILCILGQNLIPWASKTQLTIALSTTEAKYISIASCCTQLLWMKHQLEDYQINENNIPIYCDNTAAICLLKNPILHSRGKHIEIKHHFCAR